MILNNTDIAGIDLQPLGNLIQETEFRNYFLEVPSKEHYKLLAYISTQFTESHILDIGTYKGCSALALAFNPTNQVTSFDIGNFRAISETPPNVDFKLGDFTDSSHIELVQKSSVILLDTDHTGPFEYKSYNYLKQIGWKGYFVLDDIHLNDVMKEFWGSITEEKSDVTELGHWSGTGIVTFK